MTKEIQHKNPAWGDKANFIIAAKFKLDGESDHKTEQLWAKKITDYTFEICCIPFFVYDLTLADIVETDKSCLITKLLKRSNYSTFRVWFKDTKHKEAIESKLKQIGCFLEWKFIDSQLLAIAVKSKTKAQQVADFLWQYEKIGGIEYETGI